MILKQIRVIDPLKERDEICDLHIADGKIATDGTADGQVIDCEGLVCFPGLIDIHVHLRDPGLTYKEDILSGTQAAVAGGFTTVCCMPNTIPALDTAETLAYVTEKAQQAYCRVLPIAAVTLGQKGEQLTDFVALKQAGAVAFSDDGHPVESAKLLREAMFRAKDLDMPIISHCEDGEMVANHGANEGAVSEKLGIPGRPAVAEALQVARDILLSEDTGCHVHIAHVSTGKSAELIRRAKADGLQVTAETCPQYFTLTEDTLLQKGALARMNPPLRTEEDKLAILEAVIDGTIDLICTDHAPHSEAEKIGNIAEAMSGMIGLETALGVTLTALYHTGKLSLGEIAERMSQKPSEILGLSYAGITADAAADLCIFDPDETWVVEPEEFYSKARNTPFGGMKLQGRVRYTIVNGEIVYQYEGGK